MLNLIVLDGITTVLLELVDCNSSIEYIPALEIVITSLPVPNILL